MTLAIAIGLLVWALLGVGFCFGWAVRARVAARDE